MAGLAVVLGAWACLGAAGVRLDLAKLPADNSRQNLGIFRTAQEQSNDRDDRLLAARIRRVLVADETLSLYGKNVKVIVLAGKVTLEGPVHSSGERLEITFDAASVVDRRRIDNRLTIA